MPKLNEYDIRKNKLLEAGRQAIEKFKPKEDGTTYCNFAVDFICKKMGLDIFDGLVANAIVDLMKRTADFAIVHCDSAEALANDGRLVIAGIQEQPHGHVAVCMPGKAFYSGKWVENAPLIANVGKRNGIMGANYGFGDKPEYFAYINKNETKSV